MIIYTLFLLIIFIPNIEAGIRFGSKNSSFTLLNDSSLQVASSNFKNEGGTIKQKDTSSILGNSIDFDYGLYQTDKSTLLVTGAYQPDISGTGTITLSGSPSAPHLFRAAAGVEVGYLSISGSDNRLEGFPLFKEPLTLQDSNTTLTVAIKTACNQNIALNGGIIVLEDDLIFADGFCFTGSGTVKLNGRRLAFGSEDLAITSSIYWIGAADIAQNGRIDLSASWTFEKECYLNGDSVVLNLNPNGSLTIRNNSSLRVRQVKIGGLGNEPELGKIYFEDTNEPSSSELRSQRAALALTSTYTISSGHVIAEVASTQIITRDKTLFFEKPGRLTVDGVNLFYKTRTYPDSDNIQPTFYNHPDSAIRLENQGDILHYKTFLSGQGTTVEFGGSGNVGGPPGSRQKYSMKNNVYLGQYITMKFVDGDSELTTNGYFIHCSQLKTDLIKLEDAGVFFTDIVFKDFRPQHIQADSTSFYTFLDNVTIELAEDIAFDSNESWTFQGYCKIDGKGRTVSMGDGKILLKDKENGAPATLIIQDIVFDDIKDGSIEIETTNNSKIIFKDVKMHLAEDVHFSQGYFDVEGELALYSRLNSQPVSFFYDTNCTLYSEIKKASMLQLDRNVTFSYNPQTANNDLLQFEDRSATLFLNGGNIYTSDVGLQLTKGTILVDQKCTFSNEGTSPSQAIIFGDGVNANNDLHVAIMPAGSIDVAHGTLYYNNVNG